MRRDNGMQRNVARALDLEHATDRRTVENVSCRCGRIRTIAFNGIGQMVERCDCGFTQLYRGPRTLSRAEKQHEEALRYDDWAPGHTVKR